MRHSKASTTSNPLAFLRELERFGPDQRGVMDLDAACEYCRQWGTSQYENFTIVSWLLPRNLRQDFYNVYAFCRWSDNLADEVQDSTQSMELLDWWNEQLELCYCGTPIHPVMVALQQTINRHQLPMNPFLDLLSAFRQDQTTTRYADDGQLLDYCRRSANPVGRILLQMAKVTDGEAGRLSDKICSGLQLANFCQDMSRDAMLDRIYAPRSLWSRHDVSEEMLLARQPNVRLQSMLAEWVASVRVYLIEGWPLVDQVPRWLRTDIDLFVRGGLAVLLEIDSSRFDVWTRRPSVSKWTKRRLLIGSLLGHPFGHRQPLDAAQRDVRSHG